MTIEQTVVRDAQPQTLDQYDAAGVASSRSQVSGEHADVTLRASTVERCYDAGAFAADSRLLVESCIVRDTQLDRRGRRIRRGRRVPGRRAPEPRTTAVAPRAQPQHRRRVDWSRRERRGTVVRGTRTSTVPGPGARSPPQAATLAGDGPSSLRSSALSSKTDFEAGIMSVDSDATIQRTLLLGTQG